MKIAFYKGLSKGTTPLDKGICLATVSPYSHCEIVFSDGQCASASFRDGGVRFADINMTSGRWDVFNLNLPASQETAALAMFNLYEGSKYDMLGAIAGWMRIDLGSDSFFCSKMCAAACGLEDTARSPASLLRALYRLGLVSSKTILWDNQ